MSRERGFTLLEILVAVALLALLGFAAALTLNSGLRSQQILGENMTSLRRLQLTQQLIQRDLEQIVARRGRDEQGDHRDQALFAANDDVVLEFYKSGRRILQSQQPGSDLEHVRYRLRHGRLIRDGSRLIDTPTGTAWHSATLLEALLDVELRFFHDRNWIDQWPPVRPASDPGSFNGLPQAIEVTLTTDRYGPVTQIMLLPGPL